MSVGVLSDLNLPEDWHWEPLWSVAPRIKETGMPEGRPLSVFLQAGVVPRDSRDDNHNRLGENLANYLVVQPGDLVFNKLRTWQGGLGVSDYHGIVSPAYFVCRPSPHTHPRFLHYLLLSSPYLTELTRISKWMPPSQFDIPWENLRKLPLAVPPLEEQRRIADFLDSETKQIENLLNARRRQLHLLTLRTETQKSQSFEHLSKEYPMGRFKHVITKIEQGWSPECENNPAQPGQWGVMKAGCVNGGVFNQQENKTLPKETKPRIRYQIKEGDLLMSRASGSLDLIGSVAVVPRIDQNLLLCDKIYRLHVDKNKAIPEFISFIASTPQIREQIKLSVSGATGLANNLPSSQVASLPIPLLPLKIQKDIVRSSERQRISWEALRSSIDRQLTLLAERRQALITAAVTGQLDGRE